MAVLTGAQVVGGRRPEAGEHHARPARHGQARHRHQGQHHHRRRWRESDDVKGRINQIKAEIDNTDSDWDREKLQERLAKLAGGVAVIKVGAATEIELKEKKHRIEDAVSATRAAIEEGVVAGGGVALIRARKAVAKVVKKLDGDQATGARTVWESLIAPTRYIAENAGLEGSVWVQQVEAEEGPIGLNAETGELTDLIKAGIVDPAKVTRAALQNAASIAAMVLTTEALVADKPEPPAPADARWRRRHGRHARHDVRDPRLWSHRRSRAGTGTAPSRDCMSVVARDDRVLRPFWLHQLAEYLIGMVLIAMGLQSPDPVVPTVAGGLVVLNAAFVEGPLGAFRAISRRTHRRLDLVVIGLLVVAAVLPWLEVDNTSRVTMVVIAVVLAVVWWNSSFERRRVVEGAPPSTAARPSAGRLAVSPAMRPRRSATARRGS